MWPGGHQAPTYGWSGSVTRIRRKPCGLGRLVGVVELSSFMSLEVEGEAPREPLISIRSAFLRPVANRVASNDAERAAAEAGR